MFYIFTLATVKGRLILDNAAGHASTYKRRFIDCISSPLQSGTANPRLLQLRSFKGDIMNDCSSAPTDGVQYSNGR